MFPVKINKLKFNSDNTDYVYIGNYNAIFKDSNLFTDIVNLLPKCSEDEIIKQLKTNYSVEEIKNTLESLNRWFIDVKRTRNEKKIKYDNISKEDWLNQKCLSALWLNISHDCNLRCIYCYGDSGTYGNKRELMTIDKAKEAIDYWFKYLDKTSEKISVFFFGGEPLMNKQVLSFSVNYINSLLNKYDKFASYFITTNGTIMDEDILKILIENGFKITISLDGDEKVQDKNRPFTSGKGSFSKVKETVHTLRKHYNGLLARLTLTHENVKNFKNSVEKLWEIGITNITYDIVISDNENLKITKEDIEILKPQLDELTEITYKNMLNDSNNLLLPLIKFSSQIHHNSLNYGCAFNSKNVMMVEPNGEIFKCHRLIENSEFASGNISTGVNFDKYFINKTQNDKCNNCWASSICTSCAQVNYSTNNDINNPYDIWCENRKILIEQSLKLYTKIYHNSHKIFNKFYGGC